MWRQAWRSELGSALSLEQAFVFWDLLKAYEHVSHSIYAREARATCFPIRIARLSLTAYMWPRTLSLDKCVSAPLYPMRGIVAGSTAATFEIRMYMLVAVRAQVDRYHSIMLLVHIDDIAHECLGESQAVVVDLLVQA